jgi:hypothetical protein
MTLGVTPILILELEGLRGYRLGYKLHLAVDASPDLPLACTAAPANENEKKHAPKLLEKTVKATNGQTKVLVADSQYSSRKLRRRIYSHGIKPVIPYPSNQKPAEAEFLRIDKRFKAHGPEGMKRLYRHKASDERAISRLKQHLNLEKPQGQRPKKHPHTRTTMHNSHATRSFNSHKTWKTGTNKGNNKADIKLTRKHQFSNTLARMTGKIFCFFAVFGFVFSFGKRLLALGLL